MHYVDFVIGFLTFALLIPIAYIYCLHWGFSIWYLGGFYNCTSLWRLSVEK